MSEDPVPNKIESAASNDADYDAIHDTLSETAQGRRFLDEHARRCRSSDLQSSLAAIERIQAAISDTEGGRIDLGPELPEIAEVMVRARAEIDSILQKAERATAGLLAAADEVQTIANTLREAGSDGALCDRLDAQTATIRSDAALDDLTGEHVRALTNLVRSLEDRIDAALAAHDKEAESAQASLFPEQAEADSVSPESEEDQERQDATLEEIGRKMAALDPLPSAPQSVDSIAEAELAEAELEAELEAEAGVEVERTLVQWAVELPSPAKPQTSPDGSAPLADWIVEHPDAPKPDSEPAWLILHRMELEIEPQVVVATGRPDIEAGPPSATAAASLLAEVAMEPAVTQAPEDSGLFVAEAMSQLADTLRPDPLLPQPELGIRTELSGGDAMTELHSTLAHAEMRLLPADEHADLPIAEESPAETTSASISVEHAAAVLEQAPAPVAPEEPPAAAEPESDDFLFEPEQTAARLPEAEVPAARPMAPAFETAMHTPERETVTTERETLTTGSGSGTLPDPELSTRQTAPGPRQAEQQESSDYDPLAPLRTMSAAQKIALFS